jgi:hypothetical protein
MSKIVSFRWEKDRGVCYCPGTDTSRTWMKVDKNFPRFDRYARYTDIACRMPIAVNWLEEVRDESITVQVRL